MSTSPPNKKRAFEVALVDSHFAAKSRSRTAACFVSQQQIESLQAELDHERSLRQLDQKRAQQVQQRLEKQVELAVEEASESKSLLEDVRTESERLAGQLRQARDEALQELRNLQMDMDDERGEESGLERMWQEKCRRLETQLASRADVEDALRQELEDLRADVETRLHREEEEEEPQRGPETGVENAPSGLMKELCRVRIELAEAERQQRQLTRQVQNWERRNKLLIQEREEARLASKRLPVVEKELTELRRQHETTVAENASWIVFAQSLTQQLRGQDIVLRSTTQGPPEVGMIIRFLEKAQSHAAEMARQKQEYQDRYEHLKESIVPAQAKIKEFEDKERSWNKELAKMESQLEESKDQVERLQAQEAIYKREADSLRSLIKTFDDLPLSPKATGPGSPKLETASKTLEVSLSTAKEELNLVKQDREVLTKKLDEAKKSKEELAQELDRVKEKFGKLREAWQAERVKVQSAEERAHQAEALAGKGSFDPEQTRVLHFRETPLTEALKQEIDVLKRQLEAVKGDKKPSHGVAVDPDKLNQRLKENFKEQISLFREGVYLMTGFKVDMLPGCDRPTFRVRSVFAENEDDQLLLKWPKGDEVKSLDILKTDFAQLVATTPSYKYMTQFHSLPAFLASVQLSLFEKQTVQM